MKKIILTLLMIIINFPPAYSHISVKSIGETVISQNRISKLIQIIEDSIISFNFSIKVRAIDSYIINETNPQYKIPINKVFLSDNEKEFQLQPNAQITLFYLNTPQLFGFTKNYNCIIKDIGILPPGNYSARLHFQTQSKSFTYNAIYNLSFTIKSSQNISTLTNPINIRLTPKNVFELNTSISNTTPAQIQIKSNDY